MVAAVSSAVDVMDVDGFKVRVRDIVLKQSESERERECGHIE